MRNLAVFDTVNLDIIIIILNTFMIELNASCYKHSLEVQQNILKTNRNFINEMLKVMKEQLLFVRYRS